MNILQPELNLPADVTVRCERGDLIYPERATAECSITVSAVLPHRTERSAWVTIRIGKTEYILTLDDDYQNNDLPGLAAIFRWLAWDDPDE